MSRPTVDQMVANVNADEMAKLKRLNALIREKEAMYAVLQHVLEWEAKGYLKGGPTLREVHRIVDSIGDAK